MEKSKPIETIIDELISSVRTGSPGELGAVKRQLIEAVREELDGRDRLLSDMSRDRDRIAGREAAMRAALQDFLAHRTDDKDGNYVCWVGETTFVLAEQALAGGAGYDHVSKESVRPVVEALSIVDDWDDKPGGPSTSEMLKAVRRGLAIAFSLGLTKPPKSEYARELGISEDKQ